MKKELELFYYTQELAALLKEVFEDMDRHLAKAEDELATKDNETNVGGQQFSALAAGRRKEAIRAAAKLRKKLVKGRRINDYIHNPVADANLDADALRDLPDEAAPSVGATSIRDNVENEKPEGGSSVKSAASATKKTAAKSALLSAAKSTRASVLKPSGGTILGSSAKLGTIKRPKDSDSISVGRKSVGRSNSVASNNST
jgi:hypothetical protein